MKRRFPFYVVAKEFNIPLEEVMSWPLSRTFEYFQFVKLWYEIQYGDPEDMDFDIDDYSSQIPNIPKSGRSVKSMLRGSKIRQGYKGKTISSNRGAGSHTYKFK